MDNETTAKGHTASVTAYMNPAVEDDKVENDYAIQLDFKKDDPSENNSPATAHAFDNQIAISSVKQDENTEETLDSKL